MPDDSLPPADKAVLAFFEIVAFALGWGGVDRLLQGKSWLSVLPIFAATILTSYTGFKWSQIKLKVGNRLGVGGQYRRILIVIALLLLTAYDIYDRHANGSPTLVPWWHYVPILLGVVAMIWLIIGGLASANTRPKESLTPDRVSLPQLVIHRAVYAAGLPTEVSVTKQLQDIVRDGIAIIVDSTLGGLLPHDPAFGIPKRLDVEYSYGTDTRVPVSRTERPAGEIMRLVLPEDTEVARLKKELSHCQAAHSAEKANDLNEKAKAENRAIQLEAKLGELERESVGGFLPLQKDAIRLSRQLLEFLKRLGPSPTPKYTAEDIDRMTAAQTKALIEAEDGDFSEACEYYRPDSLAFTHQGLKDQPRAHWKRLLPWYQKVEAGYTLELKTEVETMRNRFAMYGVSDGVLLLPVEGKDADKNIRAMAAKFWELAYKIGEEGSS
jgi:hypothetical protein